VSSNLEKLRVGRMFKDSASFSAPKND
jgi:hypothetical protein